MPDFNVSRRNPHHWDVSAVGVADGSEGDGLIINYLLTDGYEIEPPLGWFPLYKD